MEGALFDGTTTPVAKAEKLPVGEPPSGEAPKKSEGYPKASAEPEWARLKAAEDQQLLEFWSFCGLGLLQKKGSTKRCAFITFDDL